MHTHPVTIALIVVPFLLIFCVSIYGLCVYLKYKINYNPDKELNRPLIQPPCASNLERTCVLVRDADSENGLVGKVIEKLEHNGI